MLFPIFIFCMVVFIVLTIFFNIEYQRRRWRVSRRIKIFGGKEIAAESDDSSSGKVLEALGKIVAPKEVSKLQKTFLRAGFRKNITMAFYGSKVAIAISLPVIFSLITMTAIPTLSSLKFTLVLLVLTMVGFYLPDVWLKLRVSRRKDQIFKAFPDALDLMVVCVEAGISLDAAINKVGDQMALGCKPLSYEFKLVGLELRAGKSRKEALQNLALRCDLDDVTSLVTLLIQTDKFGTSVAQALRVYSDSMRTTRQQKAEEMAAKLPVKMILPMLIFIFPSLFVVVLGPGAIRIYKALVMVIHR